MNYDDGLKHLLTEIDNDSFEENNILPELGRDKVMRMLYDCEKQGFISHSSSKQKLVTGFMDGNFMLHPTTYVTRQGRHFLEGKENSSTPTNQYNIHSVSGANFGDHGSITINYGASISDIQSFIESNIAPEDKAEATELVNTLEKNPITPGILKRFDNVLVKYPGLSQATGQFLLSVFTGQFPS